MTLGSNPGDDAQGPEPGPEPGPEYVLDPGSPPPTDMGPAEPPPGPPPGPMYAPPQPTTGWVIPGQPGEVPDSPPVRRNPIVVIVGWALGLALLGAVAVIEAAPRFRALGRGDGYATGYALGAVGAALLIGVVVKILFERVRRSNGGRRVAWVWVLPIAAVILVAESTTASGAPSSAPLATNPPASAYTRIVAPYTLVPATVDDAQLVAKMKEAVGQGGFTDSTVVRVLGGDRSFAGYLIVVAGSDTSSDPQSVMAGMLDSFAERSVSPDMTTIDGRTVAVFSASGAWSAAWFDRNFFATVVAGDQASVQAIAKAVLDAR